MRKRRNGINVQRQLAAALNLSQQTVSKNLRDGMPPTPHAARLWREQNLDPIALEREHRRRLDRIAGRPRKPQTIADLAAFLDSLSAAEMERIRMPAEIWDVVTGGVFNTANKRSV